MVFMCTWEEPPCAYLAPSEAEEGISPPGTDEGPPAGAAIALNCKPRLQPWLFFLSLFSFMCLRVHATWGGGGGEGTSGDQKSVCLRARVTGCCELLDLGTRSKLISRGRTGSSLLNHRAIRAAQFSKQYWPDFLPDCVYGCWV